MMYPFMTLNDETEIVHYMLHAGFLNISGRIFIIFQKRRLNSLKK